MASDGFDRAVSQIHVVLGEAGEPQRAFADVDDALALRDRWRDGPVKIYASVETVELVEADSDA